MLPLAIHPSAAAAAPSPVPAPPAAVPADPPAADPANPPAADPAAPAVPGVPVAAKRAIYKHYHDRKVHGYGPGEFVPDVELDSIPLCIQPAEKNRTPDEKEFYEQDLKEFQGFVDSLKRSTCCPQGSLFAVLGGQCICRENTFPGNGAPRGNVGFRFNTSDGTPGGEQRPLTSDSKLRMIPKRIAFATQAIISSCYGISSSVLRIKCWGDKQSGFGGGRAILKDHPGRCCDHVVVFIGDREDDPENCYVIDPTADNGKVVEVELSGNTVEGYRYRSIWTLDRYEEFLKKLQDLYGGTCTSMEFEPLFDYPKNMW